MGIEEGLGFVLRGEGEDAPEDGDDAEGVAPVGEVNKFGRAGYIRHEL